MDGRDEQSLGVVAELLDLSDADRKRLESERTRAQLTRTQDRFNLTLEALELTDDKPPRLERREIDMVAERNVVVTVHVGRVGALERFIDRLEGETRIGALDAADLLSSLVDEVIGGYYQLVEAVEREIDDLDQRALHARRQDDVLGGIVSIRRRIGLIRRTLAPHREALATLARPEMRVEETVGQPWPGLVDRLEGALSSIDGLRDSLLGTYDVHMGRVSQRANDVMKTLTLLSAILLPAVVLAGIMGMNFKLGFFDDATNFFIVLGVMAAMAVAILAISRWRGWI